jgi:hypothetical protein
MRLHRLVYETTFKIAPMTTKQVLRWLAVLPGALLGGVAVMFPVHWIAMYIHHFGTGESLIETDDGRGLLQSLPLESLERFGYALFVPGTIIATGALIAPKFHFVAGIVLTILLVSGMCYLFVKMSSQGAHFTDSTFRIILTCVLWLVSVTFSLFHARKHDKEAQAESLRLGR